MKFLHLPLFLFICAAAPALALETPIECTAQGMSFSNDLGSLSAVAQIRMIDTQDSNGLRVLKSISGEIYISPDGRDYDTYFGAFEIDRLSENPEYRPTRYYAHSQFRNFDATDTHGSSEDGMWGQFVMEKANPGAAFNAHYLFKAGDHMGGTLDLTCTVQGIR